MRIKIRDWDLHFERDRTRQWKALAWVPMPNKQGSGYRRIMAEKNGLEIFGCWNALVQVASTCTPRGDMTKYDLDTISLLTLIKKEKLLESIRFLSQVLDWVIVVENLDVNVNAIDSNVNPIDNTARPTPVGSSILSSSIQSSSIQSNTMGDSDTLIEPPLEICDVFTHFAEMRKKMRKPITKKGAGLLFGKLEKLAPGDIETQRAIIEQSIERGWTGLFPLPDDRTRANGQRYGKQDVSITDLRAQAERVELS
jgi:hypothetical protein